MKRFVANVAPERLLTRVREPVILVVAFLVETFATELADVRTVPHVDPHVRVQRRAPVEGLAARPALVRLLRRVDDLVPAKCRSLSEAFATDFADKRSSA